MAIFLHLKCPLGHRSQSSRRTAQLNSAASGWAEDDAHGKVELGEDGAFSLSSLALASVSLLVQLQI